MIIVFEAHSTTADNEAGLASGWNDVKLSDTGKSQAKEMGKRYSLEEFDAVFCSDMQRAYQTASLAFPGISSEKLFLDWRLRECDYGDMTSAPKSQVNADRLNRINVPFSNGESYTQAMRRMKSFLDDLKLHIEFKKVLVIGSRVTHFGLDYWIDSKKLEDLLTQKMIWQPGWTYKLSQDEPSSTIQVCSIVLKRDDKYLLVQEKKPSVYGKWNLPGGHSDVQETKERAAQREAFEETGYKVKILGQLIQLPRPADNLILNAYLAKIVGGELKIQEEEILDVGWFSLEEILAMRKDLRDPVYIISAIEEALVI